MKLALEYAKRDKKCETFLSLPISTFLVDNENNRYAILIKPSKEKALIKFFNFQIKEGSMPACEEKIIELDEIFNEIKLKKLNILSYSMPLFPLSNYAITSDEPDSSWQERQYKKYNEELYNSSHHIRVKRQFLNDAFVKLMIDDPSQYYLTNNHYYMKISDKKIINTWNKWKRTFLIGEISGEFVFSNIFSKMNDMQEAMFVRNIR